MTTRPEYVETTCKSAINRVQGMPYLKWSLNPYGGCVHRCRFCFAVQYRVVADQGTSQDFGTRLFVKKNLLDVLARELRRTSLVGEHITLGTATDPYQPVEGRYRLTRGALALLRDHRNPVSLLTKSPMIVRDVDVLAQIARQTSAEVFFSITTVDLELWRIVEPGTANPFHRLRAMRTLREAGVAAGVMMAPVLPGLTDSVASIEAVAAAACEHQAAYFSATALRLAPHVKEFYLGFVGDEYPGLLPRYKRAYPGTYAPKAYRDKLEERIQRIRKQYGFGGHGERRRAGPEASVLRAAAQLTLPL
ncbi:MAG: radical SAM protein [Chloroflexi bacterium]|nr:radical SAM protein [Chloroflexota bacterium]